MGERNAAHIGFLSQKFLFCLFTFVSVLFILSWLFLLRSTSHPRSIDHSFLLNSNLLSVFNDRSSKPRIPIDIQHESNTTRARDFPQKRNFGDCETILKVFMYDLPPEFHFALIGWKPEGNGIWPDIRSKIPPYPGGLNLQHSIEYWLTLDLLSSEFAENLDGRNAVRVYDSSEADVIFVPFFSCICYNRFSRLKPHQKGSVNKLLQKKLVKFLTAQEEWKKSGGRDHIIIAHHPNSLLDARMQLWPAMFILSDFGRYPPSIANVEKDVIAPYKHVIRNYANDSSDYDSRQTLLYFQGAIYRKDGGTARQELFYLLKEEKDVHFSFGSAQKDGVNKASAGMHSSKFCLNIAGDTPSSNRLFDAIASHCVPVIISDEIELPYEDILDYSEFCVFVRTLDAVKENFLINLIRNIGKDEWTRMWAKLKEIENMFEYQYPSKEDDAVQMIWKAVARKIPSIKMKLHQSKRFSRFEPHAEKAIPSNLLPRNFQ
ncbi:putative arabinosyltransferase ARAD1 [Apium graveolens]|uniref:putative arabinosyltransferase ARAD1 n=1 Tax=Apium graveolens TaxID=4045 RepID=UPI003D7A21FE